MFVEAAFDGPAQRTEAVTCIAAFAVGLNVREGGRGVEEGCGSGISGIKPRQSSSGFPRSPRSTAGTSKRVKAMY